VHSYASVEFEVPKFKVQVHWIFGALFALNKSEGAAARKAQQSAAREQ
jgi:hypothetical protein